MLSILVYMARLICAMLRISSASKKPKIVINISTSKSTSPLTLSSGWSSSSVTAAAAVFWVSVSRAAGLESSVDSCCRMSVSVMESSCEGLGTMGFSSAACNSVVVVVVVVVVRFSVVIFSCCCSKEGVLAKSSTEVGGMDGGASGT